MDPEQTAPIGAVCSGSTLFAIEALKYFSRRAKQTTFVAIDALKVNCTTTCKLKDAAALNEL